MKKRHLTYNLILYIIILLILTPVFWTLITAFRPELEINASPPVWIPTQLTLDKFYDLFGTYNGHPTVPIKNYLVNSFITALFSSFIAMIAGTMAGYVFSRFKFRGKKQLFAGFMFARAVPGIALSLPLFLMLARFRLLDKTAGLVLVYTAMAIPFVTWLMCGYFRDIPLELDSSARIDGSSKFQAFVYIDMPLARPGLSASWIFVFLTCWNEFQIANVITRTQASKTFPVGLFDYTTEFTVDWRGMAAISIIMLVPSLIFVLSTQNNLAQGIISGTVKE